jgi:hypothetical protein
MIGRRRTSRTSSLGICSAPTVWSRHKLLGMLTGAAAMVVLLVVGLVLAVVHAVRPGGNPAGSLAGKPHGAVGTGAVQSVSGDGVDGVDPQTGQSDSPADSPTLRDQLASRPLPAVPESASHPSAVSLADPGAPWLLPAATRTGPAGVPTGFTQTPQGAMAQLAAIDTAALSSASLAGARAVITGWAAPGGPTTSSWSVIRAIAALLSETDLSGGTHQLAVLPTPLMGLIKGSLRANPAATPGTAGRGGSGGSDKPVFVVPCVDFELDVTVTSTARGAAADCQRMVWTTNSRDTAGSGDTASAGGAGGRWLIGPGPEPAAGPSVWPDTDLAITVGYRDLRRG